MATVLNGNYNPMLDTVDGESCQPRMEWTFRYGVNGTSEIVPIMARLDTRVGPVYAQAPERGLPEGVINIRAPRISSRGTPMSFHSVELKMGVGFISSEDWDISTNRAPKKKKKIILEIRRP